MALTNPTPHYMWDSYQKYDKSNISCIVAVPRTGEGIGRRNTVLDALCAVADAAFSRRMSSSCANRTRLPQRRGKLMEWGEVWGILGLTAVNDVSAGVNGTGECCAAAAAAGASDKRCDNQRNAIGSRPCYITHKVAQFWTYWTSPHVHILEHAVSFAAFGR